MKNQYEMLQILRAYFAEKVPVALLAWQPDPEQPPEPLPAIAAADFLDEPPTETETRQMAVYLAEGDDIVDSSNESFIVQCQLPKIMRPDWYMSQIWPVVKLFDPTTIGMVSKIATHWSWYPGEWKGSSSSFLYFELQFSGESDDCMSGEDYG